MAPSQFNMIETTEEAIAGIKAFQLPENLSFGTVMCPIMIEANYKDGQWSPLKCVPYGPLTFDPTSKVLHYAQEIFEGLKAYNCDNLGPFLFRPELNGERFDFSARRMAMPELPKDYFLKAVETITSYSAHLIPQESGASLYIRPFMLATENHLGIKPSEEFKFLVVASPSQAYFKSGSISVLIEREAIRACPGGVGNAKTGGNYAASLQSMIEAKKLGYDQVLWLDALKKQSVEELSGMNFFAVYGDEIVTPTLTTTILDGITRKSVISIAEHLGLKVSQKDIAIDELAQDIKNKKCQEAFSCGTAVIITPINSLGERNGERYELAHDQGNITMKIRQYLLDLQEGRMEDPFKWRRKVERALP